MDTLRNGLGLLALAGLLAGCSHEHGPVSEKADTTSLGVATGLGEGGVSTAYGIAPQGPGLYGVDTNLANRNTVTAVRPAPLVPGAPGNPDAPRTSNAMQSWTSGPNLPVERQNMALEPEGEEKPAGHGAQPGHPG